MVSQTLPAHQDGMVLMREGMAMQRESIEMQREAIRLLTILAAASQRPGNG